MNWYMVALKQYATFDGRSRRKEYWFFALSNLIAMILLAIVDGITGNLDETVGLGLLSGLYCLAVFVPSIAVTVRRLHDTNHRGWWVLIGLIPLVGGIVLLVFTVMDSQPGANRFGPNPKGVIGPGTPVRNERPA